MLHFGSQQFRMRLLSQFNLIEVIVGGDSAVAIHKRLRDQVQEAVSQCRNKS